MKFLWGVIFPYKGIVKEKQENQSKHLNNDVILLIVKKKQENQSKHHNNDVILLMFIKKDN